MISIHSAIASGDCGRADGGGTPLISIHSAIASGDSYPATLGSSFSVFQSTPLSLAETKMKFEYVVDLKISIHSAIASGDILRQ